MSPIFEVDDSILMDTMWFEVEITSTKEGDSSKSIDYNKKSKSITVDDLF